MRKRRAASGGDRAMGRDGDIAGRPRGAASHVGRRAFNVCTTEESIRQLWRYPIMKMKRHWSRVCVASVAALVAANVSGQILTASCLDPAVPLVVEEARLPNTL